MVLWWAASVFSLLVSGTVLALRLLYRLIRRTGRRRHTTGTLVPYGTSTVPGDWWQATGALVWVLHRHLPPDVVAGELYRLGANAAAPALQALSVVTQRAPDLELAWWARTVLNSAPGPGVEVPY